MTLFVKSDYKFYIGHKCIQHEPCNIRHLGIGVIGEIYFRARVNPSFATQVANLLCLFLSASALGSTYISSPHHLLTSCDENYNAL